MKIHEELRERIDFIRFPLIVGVVFIHANIISVNFAGSSAGISEMSFVSTLITDYLSNVLFRLAVPMFFITSGYLFFYTYQHSWLGYTDKVRSRIKTLLIPLFFWNILWLCAIALAEIIPFTVVFFSGNNTFIVNYKVFDYLNAIFGLDQLPIAGQFWFIRDLFIMVLFAPIIYILVRWIPYIVLPALIFCWYMYIWPITIPTIPAVTFFVLGAFLGVKKFDFCLLDKFGKYLLPLYLILSVIDVLTKGEAYNNIIHNAGLLVGINIVFYTAKYMKRWPLLNKTVVWATPATFFVFAFHEPFQLIVRKILYKVLNPSTDLSILILYFAIPILVIAIGLGLYVLLKRFTPGLVKVIAGGR